MAVSTILALGWALALAAVPTAPVTTVPDDAPVGPFVDPDTPRSELRRLDKLGREFELVMSDEFAVDGRKFGPDGNDPIWTATHNRDKTNRACSRAPRRDLRAEQPCVASGADTPACAPPRPRPTPTLGCAVGLAYMRPEMATTERGFLKITTDRVMSWNKFCLTGGIVEIKFVLPGQPGLGALWPAIWMLGNLGRATFEQTLHSRANGNRAARHAARRAQSSTEGFWPWSYDQCTRPVGPEAAFQFDQRISHCDAEPGFGMHPFQGRGSPEIDILETNTAEHFAKQLVNQSVYAPNATALAGSLQLAPRVPKWMRADEGELPDRHHPWYPGIVNGEEAAYNSNFFGLWNYDSVSSVTILPDDAYSTPHKVSFEYATVELPHSYQAHEAETHPGALARKFWRDGSRRADAIFVVV
ncbi:hypothetical protein T492DRAFT_846621 [Pavlovales sp. CCMP2436]|nr:hypothetical protein T492DRAFT_846621 [Pavlovales sp. CCMP2436]